MAKVIRTATFFIFIILALPGIASDKQAILFKDSSGQTILKYHKLSVSDAEGRKVPAYMTVADASVAIVADDRYAVYPLIIDPIIEYEKVPDQKFQNILPISHSEFSGCHRFGNVTKLLIRYLI